MQLKRPTLLRAILTVLAFALSTGFKLDVAKEMEILRAAKSCCASYAQLPYQDLTPVLNRLQGISAKDPAFEFGKDGLSYFKAYRITAAEKGRTLRVRSYGFVNGRSNVALFFPVVTLLDKDKQPIFVTGRKDMNFQYEIDSFDTPPNHLNVIIDLAGYPNAEYLILHTAKDFLDKEEKFRMTGPDSGVMVGTVPIVIPGLSFDAPFRGSPATPEKRIRITLMKPAK